VRLLCGSARWTRRTGVRGESNPGRWGPAVSYGPRKRALTSFGYPGNARRVPSCGHRVPKTSTLCHQHDARHRGSTFSRDAPTSTTDERRAVGHVIERRRPAEASAQLRQPDTRVELMEQGILRASPSSRRLAFRLPPDEGCHLASFERPTRVEQSEELDQLRHDSRPSRLVARAQSRPVIPVEVLVERDVVVPVGDRSEISRVRYRAGALQRLWTQPLFRFDHSYW